jgi:hypothetical protein
MEIILLFVCALEQFIPGSNFNTWFSLAERMSTGSPLDFLHDAHNVLDLPPLLKFELLVCQRMPLPEMPVQGGLSAVQDGANHHCFG